MRSDKHLFIKLDKTAGYRNIMEPPDSISSISDRRLMCCQVCLISTLDTLRMHVESLVDRLWKLTTFVKSLWWCFEDTLLFSIVYLEQYIDLKFGGWQLFKMELCAKLLHVLFLCLLARATRGQFLFFVLSTERKEDDEYKKTYSQEKVRTSLSILS